MSFITLGLKQPLFIKKTPGFTIVELLIVIVVIAILAAITIVAYNGIQNRARVSSTAAAINNVQKKIATYQVDNTDSVPLSLNTLGITDTAQIKYQYLTNTTVSPNTYCVTVTSGNYSAFASSSSTATQQGSCAGHGAGGALTIRNVIPKPQGEVTVPWFYYLASGTAGATTGNITGLPGNVTTAYRLATTSAATGGAAINVRASYTATGPTVASIYVRSSTAFPMRIGVEPYTTVSGTTRGTISYGTTTTLSPNIWTRLSVSVPFDATYPYYVLTAYTTASVPNGTVIFTSGAMLTEGTTLYDYADGDSPGWAWTGTANNSVSTGPASPQP